MKKFLKILLIILVGIVVLSGVFVVYVLIDPGSVTLSPELDSTLAALSPQTVSVDGVELQTQPDGFSCGVTTISVVDAFIQQKDITPQALITKYSLPGGMTPDQFTDIFSKELTNYAFSYKTNLSDVDLLLGIHSQLKKGIPVPIVFGAANPFNKPYYDFHASVVTGLNLDTNEVTILNVYGFEEKLSLQDFLNRMAFRPTKDYPFIQKFVIKLGLNGTNSYIEIVKNP